MDVSTPTHQSQLQSHPPTNRGLMDSFAHLLALYDGYTCRLLRHAFKAVKQGVSFKILMAGKAAPLSCQDEKLFDCYLNLSTQLLKALMTFEAKKNVLQTPEVRSIAQGIASVLASQIGGNPALPSGGTNPVSLEKRNIIKAHIHQLGLFFDRLEGEFLEAHSRDLCRSFCQDSLLRLDLSAGLHMLENMAAHIFNRQGARLYSLYEQEANACIDGLNQLSNRKEVTLYEALLDQYLELMKTVTEVQIPALIAVTEAQGTPEEKGAVASFVADLHTAGGGLYAEGLRTAEAFAQAKSHPFDASQCLDRREEFEADLKEQLEGSQSFPTFILEECRPAYEHAIASFKDAAHRALEDKLEMLLGRQARLKSRYHFEKMIFETVSLAETMGEAFAAIAGWPAESLDALPEGQARDIIQGVAETVAIKVESIQEHKEHFNLTCKEVLNIGPDGQYGTELPPEEREFLAIACFRRLCRLLGEKAAQSEPLEDYPMPELLTQATDNEAVQTAIHLLHKTWQKQQAAIDKAMLALKKECLLYEMSTFEEMMHFSISRLRDEENPHATAFVALMDHTNAALTGILNRHGISAISPAPHTPFDGKTCEVLMAERQEGFLKGEVIKVLNAGYRQEDTVLLRANVICAR